MKKNIKQKGFTLIELLVVIAIIAILAVVVVLTLNPAQLLAQARDSNRISDFATLKSALSLYSTDVSTSTLLDPTSQLWTANITATSSIAIYDTTTTFPGWGFVAGDYVSVGSTTSRSVNGTGWIPVNLNAISSGAPIGSLPVDPTNSGNLMYMYVATTTGTFKLAAHMESSKYMTTGSGDVETGDGGNSVYTYEQGTNVAL